MLCSIDRIDALRIYCRGVVRALTAGRTEHNTHGKSHAALGHSAGGKAPYGYDRLLVDSQGNAVKILKKGEHKADKLQRIVWTPSPSEKPVVQWIFESYDKGTGLRLIADDLNRRN